MTQPKIVEFYEMISKQSYFPDQKIFQHVESYDFMEGYDANFLDIDCMLINKYGSWSYVDYNIYGQTSSYLSMLRNFGGYLYTHANNLQRMYDALNLNYSVLDNYNGHTKTTVTESGKENNVLTKTGGNKNEFTISGEKSKEFAIAGEKSKEFSISGQKSQEFTFEGSRKDEFAVTGSKATTNADTGTSAYQDSVTHKKATDTLSANYVESKDETSTALRSVKSEDTFSNYKETTERSGNNYKETTTDKSSNYKETTTDKSSNYKETTTDKSNSYKETNENSFLSNTKDSSVRSFEDRETVTEEEKSGNLGVTTSQQMIESEMNLRLLYNFYDLLFDDFIKSYFIA